MRLTTAFFSICISLCATFSINAQEGILRRGDSLLALGEYRKASLTFEQAYFFSETDKGKSIARLRKAECYKQNGQFAAAQKDLESLPLFGVEDSLLRNIRYQTALCAYLAGNFPDAEGHLARLAHDLRGQSLNSQESLLRILNYNELHQYDKALSTALTWVGYSNPGDTVAKRKTVEALYLPSDIPREKRPGKAASLSTWFPGLGQAWAGRPWEGLANTGLHITALGAGVLAVVSGYPITGYMVGAGSLQKLYYGGIRRATYLAEEYNYRHFKAFNDKARTVLTGMAADK